VESRRDERLPLRGPHPRAAPARRTRHARPATNPILRPLLLALTLGAAACAFPDPTPTPEALALVGRWEGWLDGQALHITLEPAGLGGARLDPRGFGSSVLRGEGRWIGRCVLGVGQTTPDSVLFIVHTDLGPVDLHQAVYSDLVALPGEQIVVSDAALDLLSAYEARSELQPKYRADMLHIALASVADVDVLVSWNFEHMVRFDRIRPFNAANMEQGSKVLANPLAPKGDDLWNRRRSERSRCAGNPRPYLRRDEATLTGGVERLHRTRERKDIRCEEGKLVGPVGGLTMGVAPPLPGVVPCWTAGSARSSPGRCCARP
jgi:hypothetical protein